MSKRPLDANIVGAVRKSVAAGEMSKFVAKRFGISLRMVYYYTRDIEKPHNYQGINFRNKRPVSHLHHLEDLKDY